MFANAHIRSQSVINDRYLACLEEATPPQIEQILTICLQASSIDEVFLKANKNSDVSLSG